MKKALVAALSFFLLAFFSCSRAQSAGTEFVINNGAEPQSVNPTQIQGNIEHRIYMALFEGLVTYDPQTNSAIAGVAESWERSNDDTVVTFHLRDAAWSDGEAITAQTFVDSWLYYLAPSTAAVYAYMPAMVIRGAEDYNAGRAGAETVGLRAIDEKTFEVTLVGPIPYAVDMMAHYAFSPLPMHAIQEFGDEWIRPENFVGNGPFTLKEWIPQDRLVVTKNAQYWNSENVFLDQITFLPIENTQTAYNRYKNGEADWLTSNSFPLDMLDEVKLRADYQLSPALSTYYAAFNINHPVLRDVRVRKAFIMACNMQELVERVTRAGQLATGAFVPEMAGYNPPEGFSYNPDEARRLLAEAGYPNGAGFPRLTYIYNTNENHMRIGEWLQQQWKTNLNVDVELQNMEWASFLAKRQANDFDIAREGWIGDYEDPSNFLELLLTGSGNNDGRYSNAAFDALVRQAAQMSAGEERMRVLERAESIAIAEDAAIIPMYIYVNQNCIDLTKWDGWHANAQDIHPYVGLRRK